MGQVKSCQMFYLSEFIVYVLSCFPFFHFCNSLQRIIKVFLFIQTRRHNNKLL